MMATAPPTPSRTRRRSSQAATNAPPSVITGSRVGLSRRSSLTPSLRTPTTPRPPSASSSRYERANSISGDWSAGGFGSPSRSAALMLSPETPTPVPGLGSLADELAEEDWDEDEEVVTADGEEHDAVDASSESTPGQKHDAATPPNQSRRDSKELSMENGSKAAENLDLTDMAEEEKALDLQLRAIERLVARTSSNPQSLDGVQTANSTHELFERVTERLQDLGSQTSLEMHASRLATAHNALSSHLHQQARQLHVLTQPLLSPLALPPPSDVIDDLIPLLTTLAALLPVPPAFSSDTSSTSHSNNNTSNAAHDPLHQTRALHHQTTDVLQSLFSLTDSLQESRALAMDAARRLRSARDAVDAFRREHRCAEQAAAALDRDGWPARLRDRHAAQTCRSVVQGFEDVCNGWRDRLVASAR